MASLLQLLIGNGWGDNVQTEGVRPDYGLTGAQIQPAQRSPYERTMAPGETRSAASLRDMLAEVILAAGSGAVPGVGGRGQQSSSAARYNPANYRLPRGAKEREAAVGTFLGEFHPPKDSGMPVGNLYRVGKTGEGKSLYKVLVVEDGQVRAESEPMLGSQLRRAGSYNVSSSRKIDRFELLPTAPAGGDE